MKLFLAGIATALLLIAAWLLGRRVDGGHVPEEVAEENERRARELASAEEKAAQAQAEKALAETYELIEKEAKNASRADGGLVGYFKRRKRGG